MTTFKVGSTSELLKILSTSRDGDVIQLAAGNYGQVLLKGIHVPGNVTITSADPQNIAVLNGLKVYNSSGLSFTNLEFSNVVDGLHNAFQILGSSNIVLDHLNVHGPNNMGSGMEVALMMVRSSTNVTVSNSEFSSGWHGLSMLNNTGLTVADNYFHNIRTDGVRGGGNSDLLITRNMFTDFHPATDDHPDAIQLWTTHTSTSATNITISDNLVVRGQGEPTQGIFMRDISGSVPFQNVTITGNMIAGGRYNGIAVDHIDTGTIANNVVAGFTGEKSWIRADNSTNLSVTNNEATHFTSQMKAEVGTNGNTQISEVSDGGAAQVTDWLYHHSGFSSTWASSDTSLLHIFGLSYDASLVGTITVDPTLATLATTDTGTPTHDTGSATTDSTAADVGSGSATVAAEDHLLPGGNGDDVYVVRSASDVIVEGANGGTDLVRSWIDYTLGDNVENLSLEGFAHTGTGNALDNRIIGSAGADMIYGLDGNDLLQGHNGDDSIWGGNGDDDLRGNNGNDLLYGGTGNDKLLGGAGNDIFDGGAGNDMLESGSGNDIMTGGSGNDIFRFRTADFAEYSVDRITDFTRGEDRIQLNLVDLGGGHFNFIGNSKFHQVAGELRYQVNKGDAYVMGDINGDGKADFSIKLDHVTKLAASDFIL